MTKKNDDIILNGRAKEKEIDELHQKEWRFPERSCLRCKSYKCFKGQDAYRCNFARYGCVHWDPIDNDEEEF